MTTAFTRVATLMAGAALALSAPIHAQRHDEHTAKSDFAPERVGAERMVMQTTANEAAKAPFLRGLALLHNFEYAFAAKEFRKAQQADPDFVMAYWGEAMTHNHPLWAEQDREAAQAVLSRLAADPAARAAKARSDKERQWLAAVETLYAPEGTKIERDVAYLEAMRAMLDADPQDIDARAFTGLATLGSSHGGRQISIYMEAAGLLEPGFMTHPMHPGILHYLIHSYDDPTHAPLGERMAERYAVVAPDAGHAQHMVSHIYLALADWEATEAANVNASKVVNLQREAQGRGPTSCGHYNEWLAYALLQQGKDAEGSALTRKCVADIRDMVAKEGDTISMRGVGSAVGMAIFLGVETGEWLDPIDLPGTEAAKFARSGEGHAALLRWHDTDLAKAKAGLAQMKSANTAIVEASASDGQSVYETWVERAMERGEALVEMAEGDRAAGLAALKKAAAAELALPIVFGPPVIFKPSYEILGEIHLAEGRKEEAVAAFEKSLKLAPGRKLSLAGLERARAQ
ncbi:MAG: tetratricopeptide repeat protein [Pseudomonadota bacterium]